jgi:hypothetical protein
MKGDAFPRKIHSHYGFWRALGAHLGLYLRFFVMAGLGSGVGHDAIRATVVFNNLNNKQFVVYFRTRGYGAGKVNDVAAQAESSPPGRTSAAREREAKGGLAR